MKLWDFELKFRPWNLKFWDLGFRKLRLEILIMKSGVWIFLLKTEGFEIGFSIFETWDCERFETWNFEKLKLGILKICDLKF